jgi:hypothetical protein
MELSFTKFINRLIYNWETEGAKRCMRSPMITSSRFYEECETMQTIPKQKFLVANNELKEKPIVVTIKHIEEFERMSKENKKYFCYEIIAETNNGLVICVNNIMSNQLIPLSLSFDDGNPENWIGKKITIGAIQNGKYYNYELSAARLNE